MFLHTYSPSPVLLDVGFIKIYWYGFLITLGIVLGFFIFYKLAQRTNINKNKIFDLTFWLIIWGVIGGRLYHVLSEISYYWHKPIEIFYVWNGGLGIYGVMVAGILAAYFFAKKYKINFLQILDLLMPSLALAQAIGRWGNYFNQELYGQPTDLAWGIPISIQNRLMSYKGFEFFQPVFLYESLFCLILAIVILSLVIKQSKGSRPGHIFLLYLFLYSTWRFLIEFLRIDPQPVFLSLRLGQWASLVLIILSIIFWFSLRKWYNGRVIK